MLTCKRAKFSLPPRTTYLNCAYMSPMMKSVEKAGIRGVRAGRNPVGVTPEDFFTESTTLRAAFARIINADEKRVAIIPSVSYGMANVAANVPLAARDEVIVAAEQFPSNYYVWQRACEDHGAVFKIVGPGETLPQRGKRWNEKILESISERTRVVTIAHAHWTDGTKFDLEAIRRRTKDVGALLVVDGSQSVGALPFDVAKIQPDALICTGYKWLLGPYSIGMAYFGPSFDNGRPIEENWINRLNSEDFTSLVTYNPHYQPGALRYEVGEHSNFILVPMMIKALEQIERWGVKNIQEYCVSLTGHVENELRDLGCWVEDTPYRAGHILGIRLRADMDVAKVKEAFRENRTYVSFRGSAIRVAPHLYNTPTDLNRLVRTLKRMK